MAHWSSSNGEQTDKGIVFAQAVEEGDRGAFYIATGGGGRLVVKLKPGQPGVPDGGLVGVYHHVTDDKIASLLKKDSELAEKKVEETLRLTAHHLAAEDRPAITEWKKRWPDLRNRLNANASMPKPKAGAAPPATPTKPATPPPPGQPAATPSGKDQAAYYMTLAETAGTATTFTSPSRCPQRQARLGKASMKTASVARSTSSASRAAASNLSSAPIVAPPTA